MSTSTFRRRLGAASLVLLWLLLLLSNFADPIDESSSDAAQVHAAAAHLGRLRLTAVLELVTALVLAIAVVTLVRLVRGRGATLAHVGGALGLLGTIGLALIGANHVFLAGLAQGDPAQMTAALHRAHHGAPWVLPLFFATPIAIPVLVGALTRAGFVPGRVLAAAIAFFVVDQIPGLPGGEAIAMLIGLACFAWIARRLLAMSDAEWEAPRLTEPRAETRVPALTTP